MANDQLTRRDVGKKGSGYSILYNNYIKRGQTDRQRTDISTTRPKRPKG